jgi:hypothetical protein
MENTIEDVRKWLEYIKGKYGRTKNFIEIVEDEEYIEDGQYVDDIKGKKIFGIKVKVLRVNIYTDNYKYRINAVEKLEGEKSYLGCTVSSRKPLAGEDWTRGNDLADGKLTRETWERIKDHIIGYELIELAPKVEKVEKKEVA